MVRASILSPLVWVLLLFFAGAAPSSAQEPADSIRVRQRIQESADVQEPDSSITPSRAAMLLALDSLAALYLPEGPVEFRAASLPASVGPEDLRVRGFQLRSDPASRLPGRTLIAVRDLLQRDSGQVIVVFAVYSPCGERRNHTALFDLRPIEGTYRIVRANVPWAVSSRDPCVEGADSYAVIEEHSGVRAAFRFPHLTWSVCARRGSGLIPCIGAPPPRISRADPGRLVHTLRRA